MQRLTIIKTAISNPISSRHNFPASIFEKSNISVVDNFLTPERAEMVFNLINSDIKWKKMLIKEKRFDYAACGNYQNNASKQ